MELRKCRLCKSTFRGRSDKIFCTPKCKAIYHYKLNSVTKTAAQKIDIILHRNRSILLEIMGKNSTQKKIKRIFLDNKKFNFKYITHYNINSKGKIYHHVYDFAWMEFSDDEILIIRRQAG
ncbi:MAG: hypothetical protein RQ875_13760 [Vicingaceae bacterium]|nr:hypothetical protein [Vicingaceae bacterium]